MAEKEDKKSRKETVNNIIVNTGTKVKSNKRSILIFVLVVLFIVSGMAKLVIIALLNNDITKPIIGIGCEIGNSFNINLIITTIPNIVNGILPCNEWFQELVKSSDLTADPSERKDIEKYTSTEDNAFMQALGLQKFTFTSSDEESLDQEDMSLLMKTQMAAVWENQHAGGQETILDKSSNFKIKKMQLIAEEFSTATVNGWKDYSNPSNLVSTIEVENTGTNSIDVVAWLNCSSPSKVCSAAGVGYDCYNTETYVYPEYLTDKCADEVDDCVYFTNIKQNSAPQKACEKIVLGSDDAGDSGILLKKDGEEVLVEAPYSWCFTILDLGGSASMYQAYFNAHAAGEFLARAAVSIPVVSEELSSLLLETNMIEFSNAVAVNKENPIKIGVQMPQTPIIIDESSGDPKYATITYETQDEGNLKKIHAYVVKLSPKLEYAGGDSWTCFSYSDFSDESRVGDFQNVLNVSSETVESMMSGVYGDELMQAMWEEYNSSDNENLKFCFLNLTKAKAEYTGLTYGLVSAIQSFKFSITPLVTNQNRDTTLMSIDIVYDYEQVIGPAVLNIDCSYNAFRRVYSETEYEDWICVDNEAYSISPDTQDILEAIGDALNLVGVC